jgi:multiple sugar transport system permease protein
VTNDTVRKPQFSPSTLVTLKGLLFCSPWILGLLLIYLYPMATSFYWSFTDYRILNSPNWIGLENYKTMIADPVFVKSLTNTVEYVLMWLPSSVVVALGLALLLNTNIRGMAFYRSLYYFPVLVPAVASAIVWKWVLDPQWGILNAVLRSFGLPTPGWIGSTVWAKPSLVLIALWGVGNTVVIYLASLQDVPRSLYDAAEVDGANAWQRIKHVTVPMITPTILFNVIMGMIGAFQTFTVPFVMTQGTGEPGQTLLFYSMVLYRNAFLYLQVGLGSTMAWVMLVFILMTTGLVFSTTDRWVYYGGM